MPENSEIPQSPHRSETKKPAEDTSRSVKTDQADDKRVRTEKAMRHEFRRRVEEIRTDSEIESVRNELQTEADQAYDAKWYSRLEEHGSFGAYEFLTGDKEYRQEQKRQFLRGEIENPTLDYPKLERDELKSREEKLLELKNDIITQEENPDVKQVYRWKLNEKIAELRMLQAAANGDMRRFKRYNEFVYGRPNAEVFRDLIIRTHDEITELEKSEDTNLHDAAKKLKVLLPKREGETIALPESEAVEHAAEETLKEFPDIVGMDETKEFYTAEETKQIFENVLKLMDIEGWEVVIDRSRSYHLSVSQEKKQVLIPEDRTLSSVMLRKLTVHELGTHVKNREEGEKSPLHLLGLGLDRYEQGEEGVATMREQAVQGHVDDFERRDRHLAIGLAYGLDGTPRDFKDVFTVMNQYYLAQNLSSGISLEQAKTEANNNAWNLTVRVFRGTDCKTPGVAFTKDILYREGNIAIWNLIQAEPRIFEILSRGKFDPSNKRHTEYLLRLGVLNTSFPLENT